MTRLNNSGNERTLRRIHRIQQGDRLTEAKKRRRKRKTTISWVSSLKPQASFPFLYKVLIIYLIVLSRLRVVCFGKNLISPSGNRVFGGGYFSFQISYKVQAIEYLDQPVNTTGLQSIWHIGQGVVEINRGLTRFFFNLIADLMWTPQAHEEVTSNWISLPQRQHHRRHGISGGELMTLCKQQPEGRPSWSHDAGDRQHFH